MPPKPVRGLHHVTAIAADPQRNLNFYTTVLGLRFVKKTVNFDDPGTYHLYFGDDAGSPGTILTFFPWPGARRGAPGTGEVSHTAFSVPPASIGYWERRLGELKIASELSERMGEPVLAIEDPDGMKIQLTARAESAESKPPRFSGVPAEHAIRGLFGVTLSLRESRPTAATLALLGFQQVAEQDGYLRFSAPGSALGNHIGLAINPALGPARLGAGSVHHIAFRSPDFDDQKAWLTEISNHRLSASPVMDRDYFRSIYFREPGGVLFEIATDIPGFTTDEPLESLGERLCLPEWLEPQRSTIAARLPELRSSTG